MSRLNRKTLNRTRAPDSLESDNIQEEEGTERMEKLLYQEKRTCFSVMSRHDAAHPAFGPRGDLRARNM